MLCTILLTKGFSHAQLTLMRQLYSKRWLHICKIQSTILISFLLALLFGQIVALRGYPVVNGIVSLALSVYVLRQGFDYCYQTLMPITVFAATVNMRENEN
ncbi:MAG: hypothetical protein NUK65_08815 [Firmicutes bacterium]|nr:hypothetical protein [Bacillota bacterium]